MGAFENSLGPRTQYDLNFRLGDIPVRVHPFFWITTVVMGLDVNLRGIDVLTYLLVWAVVLFVSILVHELGHIFMGRYFGSRGHVLLTAFCGLAIGSAELPKRWQRNAVSLAGPGAGFLLAAVAFGVSWSIYPDYTVYALARLISIRIPMDPNASIPAPLLQFAILNLLWVNVLWGLVNLLPIWPLDGGQICRELCQKYRDREGIYTSLIISIVTSGSFAVLALVARLFFKEQAFIFGDSLAPVFFFGIFAAVSGYLLYTIRRVGLDWEQQDQDYREPWEQDPDWWKQGGRPGRD